MFQVQSRHVLAVAAAVTLLCTGCATSDSTRTGPRSPAQLKQQELQQMQQQGQRNDIDKPMQ